MAIWKVHFLELFMLFKMTKYDSKILISQNFQKLKNSQNSKNRQNLQIFTFYENQISVTYYRESVLRLSFLQFSVYLSLSQKGTSNGGI